MPRRRDALLGAARMIEAVNRIGLAHAPDAVTTVGLLENRPNSRNVVPGEVFFTIDLRHPTDAEVAVMEAEMHAAFAGIAEADGLTLRIERIWDSPAVHFDAACVASVRQAAAAIGAASRDIVSGAGHDSAYIARVAPTAMIFIPCAEGLSHNEAESATREDVAAGAQVLLRAVLDTDQRLAEAPA
jgi:N-carbamoyl-L-amino-acid hydrolase